MGTARGCFNPPSRPSWAIASWWFRRLEPLCLETAGPDGTHASFCSHSVNANSVQAAAPRVVRAIFCSVSGVHPPSVYLLFLLLLHPDTSLSSVGRAPTEVRGMAQ